MLLVLKAETTKRLQALAGFLDESLRKTHTSALQQTSENHRL
jgi:hypothetical protein